MAKHLKSLFEGSGYDQTLKLFYDEKLVFFGVADDLVTSVDGELQVRLNFVGDKGFLHALRISDSFVVLVPDVQDVNADAYLKLVKGGSLVWPLDELVSLWEQLRYDPGELREINSVTSNELFLVWLISSQHSTVETLDLFEMADSVEKNIIAEDPDGSPSVKGVIQQLRTGDAFLEGIEPLDINKETVTAYVDEVDGATLEWKSVTLDRNYCLVNDDLAVKIRLP